MKLAPSDMFCFSLYAASHAMQQAYRPLLTSLGLTYPQYLVMRALWYEAKPMTVGQIGRAVHLESSTLTPLLKRLEAAGLIRRDRDPKDERQVRVSLTKAGQAKEAEATDIPACFAECTGETMADLARLQAEIMRIAANLQKQTST